MTDFRPGSSPMFATINFSAPRVPVVKKLSRKLFEESLKSRSACMSAGVV